MLFVPWSAGAELANQDQTKWTLNTPEWVDALTYYKSFFTDGIATTAPNTGAGAAESAFVDGSIPMLVGGPSEVGALAKAVGAGYQDKLALAKMDFPGKRVLCSLVLITLMTPGVVTFVPLFVLVSKIGLVNAYPALFLPFLTTPLGVFLMRQFIRGIPDSLIEAAQLDGAGEFRIFARVVMPLCGPPLATLGILTFLGSWNNFLWPLVAAQSQQKYTLPVALSLFSTGQSATDYGLLLAGSVLVITPMVLLFVSLQRFFIQSVAAAGIK
jgi:ABC-type glycerol-3-phosphate transport system permease component